MRDAAARGAERRGGLARVLSLRGVRWSQLDWHVVALALLLLALGLGFVHAMSEADAAAGRGDVDFASHAQKVGIALPALLVGLAIRPRWVRRNAHLAWGVCIALLVLVLVAADARNGSRRWIDLGPFDLQPSELAKVGVILALARTLDTRKLSTWREWGAPLVLALVPIGLVALQPDLGTALTLVPITMGMLYAAGARGRVLLGFASGALALGAMLWHFEIGIRDYQMQRIETWRTGWSAPSLIAERHSAAFHSYQARVAIGNGGWLGQGLGEGVANQTGWLPQRNCDSVFAVVAEEAGWVGASAVVGVYGLLVVLLLASAGALRDKFSRLTVAGVALFFGAHLFIHCAVNLGLLPLTGITLPLFSTGGSSMLATFLALGLALNLASHRVPSLDADSFAEPGSRHHDSR